MEANPFSKIMVEIKGGSIVNITDLPKEYFEKFLEVTQEIRIAYKVLNEAKNLN